MVSPEILIGYEVDGSIVLLHLEHDNEKLRPKEKYKHNESGKGYTHPYNYTR